MCNKALRWGGVVTVCEHHKCFIFPMHRLGCWKRDCCILCRHLSVQYLMRFIVVYVAASFCNPFIWWKGNHNADFCEKSEFFFFFFFERECDVWVCACVFSMHCLFLNRVSEELHKLRTWGLNVAAPMKTPYCTRLPLRKTQQRPKLCAESAGSYTKVTSRRLRVADLFKRRRRLVFFCFNFY